MELISLRRGFDSLRANQNIMHPVDLGIISEYSILVKFLEKGWEVDTPIAIMGVMVIMLLCYGIYRHETR